MRPFLLLTLKEILDTITKYLLISESEQMKELLVGLVSHLKEHSGSFVKKVQTNIVRKRVGYSEYTQWDTTVSFDEVETVDMEALLEEIDNFAQSFQEKR